MGWSRVRRARGGGGGDRRAPDLGGHRGGGGAAAAWGGGGGWGHGGFDSIFQKTSSAISLFTIIVTAVYLEREKHGAKHIHVNINCA
jgi:hypothetical protein